jgi:hypothetical protein
MAAAKDRKSSSLVIEMLLVSAARFLPDEELYPCAWGHCQICAIRGRFSYDSANQTLLFSNGLNRV